MSNPLNDDDWTSLIDGSRIFRVVAGGLLMAIGAAMVLFGVVTFCMGQPVPDESDAAPEEVTKSAPALGICVPVRVLSVYDGDTVVCEVRYKFRLRLIDAWAPEVTGPQKEKGLKAKAQLQKLCDGQIGTVMVPWHDDIGKMTSMSRVLGTLNINGDDMSYEMRKSGWAKATKTEAAEAWPE